MRFICSLMNRSFFGWLELMFGVAVVLLLSQASPFVLQILDVRIWPRSVLMIANAIVITALVTIRCAPDRFFRGFAHSRDAGRSKMDAPVA